MRVSFLLGLLLVFSESYAQTATEVFVFDLNTNRGRYELSNFRNISNNNGYDNQPSFLDNENILYARTRDGQTDIAQYHLHSGQIKWWSNTDGSEYSPLKIPKKNAVSAIRLDQDGKQRLYQYELDASNGHIILDTLVVGYHLWLDEHTIIASVLEKDQLSLYLSDLTKKTNRKITENVGRSLHHIPNSNLISFIYKSPEGNVIKSFSPETGKIKTIAPALASSEDMCWTKNGHILMASDRKIYTLSPGKNQEWAEVASLDSFKIENANRIAISPNGKLIAIVAEMEAEALAPKLENIKWIAGNWKGEAFGGQTEEIWSEPSGGSMMATFKLIENGKVVFYEIEIIRETENSLVLQLKHFGPTLKGWESAEETVDFPLLKITSEKVVFEGLSFEKISPTEMNVYVDIKQEDGSIENVKFNYKK